jgi:hypothetical protein
MQVFETTNAKVARRCRYDQHRGQKTALTVNGSLITGLVRSVMEIKSGNDPIRWIVTVVGKSCTEEIRNHPLKNPSIRDKDWSARQLCSTRR